MEVRVSLTVMQIYGEDRPVRQRHGVSPCFLPPPLPPPAPPMPFAKYQSASLSQVELRDRILAPRIQTALDTTIPSSLEKCRETGRLDAFTLQWKEGMPNRPHYFWDSDVAKVLEGVAYSLALRPDAALEAEYDRLVECIASAQQPDGYLNTYFTTVEPEKRWTNLCIKHELYCAGHLIEAAVAGYNMLGKRRFLDVMCRYADHIATVFGRGEGQKRGYPGHEEIELALVKLYHATGERRYLDLAKYFVDERGQSPNYFLEVEHQDPCAYGGMDYFQADRPVRELQEAKGHAVRAVYLYSGMADVAQCTGDETLLQVCQRLFRNIATRRMYVTGGIGSSFCWEVLTRDYDLTNGSLMYAESCAAMGLVFFAQRMLNATGDGQYADVLELALFNGVLAGISLSGDRFFYTNYLEVDENTQVYNAGAKERQPWFECSCCPTNFSRFLPSAHQYVWSVGPEEVRLNLPVAGTLRNDLGEFHVEGEYPYQEEVRITAKTTRKVKLSLRIPAWCRNPRLTLDGTPVPLRTDKGYVSLERLWTGTESLVLTLPMPVETLRANLKVTSDTGRIALKRGPIVYACETVDNPEGVANLVIPTPQSFSLTTAPGLPAGTPAIAGTAYAEFAPDPEALYFTEPLRRKTVPFLAIPYALWQNRGPANMAVWMRTEEH